jgi:outer membrane lipoprotein-sorting protein
MIKKFKIVVFGIILILFCAGEGKAATEKTVQELMDFIQAKAREVRSYQTSFVLKMQGAEGERVMLGDILFKRPDRIRIIMHMPNIPHAKQVMVSDGKTLWQYAEFLGGASKVDLATLKKEFGETYFTQPREDISKPLKELEESSVKYLGKETIDGRGLFMLEANPRALAQEGMVPFNKIKVWIDATTGLERKTVFYDAEGKEVLSRSFWEVKMDMEIPDSVFNFSPPEGTQVIDVTDETRKLIEAEKKETGPSPSVTALPVPSKN